MVESLQTVPNCLIQLQQGEKLTVPQGCQNKGGDDTNSTLNSGLVLGSTDSGRQNGGAVVLSQFLVGFVENNLIFAMLLYTGFQVVTLDNPGNTTEVFVGIYMGSGSCLLVH